MQGYTAPAFQRRVQDQVPELTLKGYENMTSSITSGLGNIASMVGKAAEQKVENKKINDTVTGEYESLLPVAAKYKISVDPDAFHKSSLGQKQGQLASLKTMIGMNREEVMAKPVRFTTPEGYGASYVPGAPGHITADSTINPVKPVAVPRPAGTPGAGTPGSDLTVNPRTGEVYDNLPPLPGTKPTVVPFEGNPNYGLPFYGPRVVGGVVPMKQKGAGTVRSVKIAGTDRYAFLDDEDKTVDPDKLRAMEDVPGTGSPDVRFPNPYALFGQPGGLGTGMHATIKGTGKPPDKRPITPPLQAKPVAPPDFRPGIFTGGRGETFQVLPNGNSYLFNRDTNEWVVLPGIPAELLKPGVMPVAPVGATQIPRVGKVGKAPAGWNQ